MAVRRESVVLDLDDRLTPGLIRAAAAAGALNRELKNVDGQSVKTSRSMSSAEGEVKKFDSTTSSAARNVEQFGGHLSGVAAAAIAGTSALIPLAGAAAGVAAAFAAPLAFVGGGLTLFGILDSFAVAKTQKQLQGIDQLKTKLAGLKKGTADYATAAQQLKVAQGALTPAQHEYANSLDHLHTSFDTLLGGKSGDQLLGPIAQALDLAADLLPKVQPIIGAVSGGLTTLLTDLDKFSKTNEFSGFVRDVSQQIGPDLESFGHILGGFTKGVGDLLVVTGKKFSPEVLHGVENLTDSFSHFAKSKDARQDVQNFLDYFHKVGPEAAHTIGSVARGLSHVVQALAPLGPPTLAIVKGIADEISSIPIPVLTALAGATVGLVGLSKVGKFGSSLSAGANLVSGGKIAGGALGVQKVYVVNFPPGLGGTTVPGEGGKPPVVTAPGAAGAARTAEEIAAAKAASAAGDAVKAAGGTRAEIAAATGKAFKEGMTAAEAAGESAFVRGALKFGKIGGLTGLGRTLLATPLPALGSVGNQKREDFFSGAKALPLPAYAKDNAKFVGATSAKLDELNAKLSKASQGMELVGHSAQRAFSGDATAAVTNLSGHLEKINGAKAEQALDLVGHSAATNFARAGGDADTFKGKLNSIPSKKSVTVTANTGQASSAIAGIIAGLSQIHDKHVTVTTTNANIAEARNHADGGYISGPGGPRSDSIPAYLSNGEFVVNAAATSRNLGLLHSINAKGYASGGPVGNGNGGDDLGRRINELTKAIQKDTSSRDNLRQQEQQIAQTVSGSFRTDLFAAAGVWSATSGPNGTLNSDIANVRKFNKALHLASKKGLSGGAFSALAQSGNLQAAQFEASQTRAQLAHTQRLFQLRNRLTARTGQFAGNVVEGQKLDAIRAEIHAERMELRAEHHKAAQRHKAAQAARKNVGHDVKDGLNGVSADAQRHKRRGQHQ